MKRLVTGEEYQSAQSGYFYWPKYFGTGVDGAKHPYKNTVPDKTKLSDVLSNGAKSKWDDVMEKNKVIEYSRREITLPSLKDNIIKLEGKFVSLKNAVDSNDYSLQNNIKQEIIEKISEVLI